MEFSVQIKPLIDALRIGVKLAKQFYSGSPFHGVGALIAEAGNVYMMTSNGEQFITLPVPDAKVTKEGRGVISFLELIRVLDGSADKKAEATIQFALTDDVKIGDFLIKKGKSQHRLRAALQDEYPTWEAQTEKLVGEPENAWLTTADFLAALNYATIASSWEESRPVLQFVEMSKVEGEDRLQFLCADGFRLHMASVQTYEFPVHEGFYGLLRVPALKVFMDAEKLLGSKIGVHLYRNAIRIISSSGAVFHSGEDTSGYKFPDVKRLFPKTDFTLELPVAEVNEALQESKHYSHKNNETLTLTVRHTSLELNEAGNVPTLVRFAATDGTNRVEIEADGYASQVNTPCGVGINHVFLREAIHPECKLFKLQTIVNGDGSITAPMLLPFKAEGEDGVEYAALVMPMSMRDVSLTPLAMAKLREQHPDIYMVYTCELPPEPELVEAVSRLQEPEETVPSTEMIDRLSAPHAEETPSEAA